MNENTPDTNKISMPSEDKLRLRESFEQAYALHAIAQAEIIDSVDSVQARIKADRFNNTYTHDHLAGAWLGFETAHDTKEANSPLQIEEGLVQLNSRLLRENAELIARVRLAEEVAEASAELMDFNSGDDDLDSLLVATANMQRGAKYNNEKTGRYWMKTLQAIQDRLKVVATPEADAIREEALRQRYEAVLVELDQLKNGSKSQNDSKAGEQYPAITAGSPEAALDPAAGLSDLEQKAHEVLGMLVGPNALQSFNIHEEADIFGRVKGTWGATAQEKAKTVYAELQQAQP